MSRAKLLLSTAVGLAFVVAGPAALAVGKLHKTGAKGHASISPAVARASGFKLVPSGQTRKSGLLKEKFLVETWGVSTINLLGGTAPEDSASTIVCKKACTVVTENTAEFLSYYSYNQVGICPIVDGYLTNGACFFSGTVNPSDMYTNRTNQTNLKVAAGTHTVQTYLYTLAPAYLGHYQNDYHVYE